MLPYLQTDFYNPSANYGPGRQVAASLQTARSRIAAWLGARPTDIVFTAGGTESVNLAIHGLMRSANQQALATGRPQPNVIVSAIEHDAVLAPAAQYDRRLAAVNGQGLVDVADLARQIDDQTLLVSVMYANNEVGTIQPLKEIAGLIETVRRQRRQRGVTRPLYLHSDACQAGNHLDLHVARLGVDLMTLNGGKVYGPKQSGVLYVKSGIVLEPQIAGGGQERGRRSGTENVAACIGLAAALDQAQQQRKTEVARLQSLQRVFIDQLKQQLPMAHVNGSLRKRLPGNVHLTIPGADNERLLVRLEADGVLAAAGSACSASSQAASHVLLAMGLSEADARASLRFSMGRATDEAAVRRAVAALAAAV